MSKRVELATWFMSESRDVIYHLIRFVWVLCELTGHKKLIDYNSHSSFKLLYVFELVLDHISNWEEAQPVGEKPGKVYIKHTQTTSYITLEVFCPQGNLRFVHNKLVPKTAKNYCFIEFVPNRGRRTLLDTVISELGDPDELSVRYTGKSVEVGLTPR